MTPPTWRDEVLTYINRVQARHQIERMANYNPEHYVAIVVVPGRAKPFWGHGATRDAANDMVLNEIRLSGVMNV